MGRTRVGITTLALLLALLGGSFLGSGSRGLAQDDSPPRPSHIHAGDCDEPGGVIQPLTSLTVPGGETLGNADAVLAEAAFSNVPQSLDELLAEDHSLKVHLSQAQIQVYLVCGDIGGALDADGALIVGLKEQDGSGYAGIAYLVPAANGSTNISVMIAKILPGGGPGDDAGAAATDQDQDAGDDATADDDAAAGDEDSAEDEGQAAGPQVVGVALTEFAINMPTELPAGPVRFNVTNTGAVPHNFVIEGEGISERLAENLEPRTSGRLELDLAPGTYVV